MDKVLYEHIRCDLCNSDRYKVRYRKPDNWLWINQFEFPVVECLNCGLVYLNPRPTEQSMSIYYPPIYHNLRNTEEWLYKYSIETEYLPELKNETVLDIGCARGDFLHFLKQKYTEIKTFGIDLYSDGVDFKEICFTKNRLDNCNFDNSQFDIITAWAVFEHLNSPSRYFKEVSRILKGNGRFYFLVTNSESLYGRKAYIEDIPRHTYHFSENILKKYAEKYGFNMLNCWYDDRVWDGRGMGTFYFLSQKITNSSWERRFIGDVNKFQRIAGKIGNKLDEIVFKTHWEAKYRKSGIIIVEFTKK